MSNADALAGIAKPARASAFDSIDTLMNADDLAGIAMPARASASSSIDAPMNAEALAGFVPKGPQGLLEATS